jgi:hypothetical protein
MARRKWIFFLFCLVMISGNTHGSDLFPEIAGWKMQTDQRVYNSNDLWELINGAADIFLSYSFKDLHIAEYSKNDQIIRVELYQHSTPENTYGIYTAERMPDYPQVSIGSQGYKSQGVLNFFTGNYYIKIMSAGQQEADESVIALVAGKVNDQLAQPDGLPDVLQLFPEEGREYLSDTYIAQNFLGYSFFHSAFTMRYKSEAEFQLFIIKSAPEEIQRMMNEYLKVIKLNSPEMKGNLQIINDPFNGTVYLECKNNYLVGVINTTNEAKASEYITRVMHKIP